MPTYRGEKISPRPQTPRRSVGIVDAKNETGKNFYVGAVLQHFSQLQKEKIIDIEKKGYFPFGILVRVSIKDLL